jgi:hypothetical protein
LHRPEFRQRILPRRVVEVIEQNKTHTGRDRAHLRLAKSFRNLFARFLQTLVDQLAREVNVRPVFEIHVHDRQPKVGNGADVFDTGQPVHGRFHGIRDEFLNLFRRKPFGHGEHLHQVRRHIRKRVDRQSDKIEVPRRHNAGRENYDQQSIAEGKVDEAWDHTNGVPLVRVAAVRERGFI